MIFEYNLSEVKGSRKSVENRPGAEALAGGTINIIYFILLYTDSHGTALKCEGDNGAVSCISYFYKRHNSQKV